MLHFNLRQNFLKSAYAEKRFLLPNDLPSLLSNHVEVISVAASLAVVQGESEVYINALVSNIVLFL